VGWLLPMPDLRDYSLTRDRYLLLNITPAAFAVVDLRQYCSPIENQLDPAPSGSSNFQVKS
jgi:hypothetical protein